MASHRITSHQSHNTAMQTHSRHTAHHIYHTTSTAQHSTSQRGGRETTPSLPPSLTHRSQGEHEQRGAGGAGAVHAVAPADPGGDQRLGALAGQLQAQQGPARPAFPPTTRPAAITTTTTTAAAVCQRCGGGASLAVEQWKWAIRCLRPQAATQHTTTYHSITRKNTCHDCVV